MEGRLEKCKNACRWKFRLWSRLESVSIALDFGSPVHPPAFALLGLRRNKDRASNAPVDHARVSGTLQFENGIGSALSKNSNAQSAGP
jgi:hypothetical protein